MWFLFILLLVVNAQFPSYSDDEERILNMFSYIDLPESFPEIIKLMPKGAVLSLDIINLLGSKYILTNITRREDLYICKEDEKLELRFSNGKNLDECYETIELARAEERIEKDFNDVLRRELTLSETDRKSKKLKNKIKHILEARKSLLLYKPVFRDYIWNLLSDFYKKKYIYVEFKGPLYQLYDLDGTLYPEEDTLKLLDEINESFKKKYVTCSGFKYIVMSNDIDKFNSYKNMYPNLLSGLHIQTLDKKEITSKLANNTKLFLSTDYLQKDTSIPNNFFSQITRFECTDDLFGNTILNKLKKYNVPVEVYPVDNLKMYKHLNLYEYNLTIIPKYDDLNDVYTFLVIDDIKKNYKYFKKLFQNSLLFSSMTDAEKTKTISMWEDQWKEMIHNMVSLGH